MPKVCIHLDDKPEGDYAQFFSGVGLEFALICLNCCKDLSGIAGSMKEVSPERFAFIEQEGYWEPDREGVQGRPQIYERSTGLSFNHETALPAGSIPGSITRLKPVLTSTNGRCLALTDGGDVFSLDPGQGATTHLLNAVAGGFEVGTQLDLHVSPAGEMVALTEVKGQRGVILDLATMQPTMKLNRGKYHSEQTAFPISFLEMNGQLRLVHATDWNRLDIADPRTGELFTERSYTAPEKGHRSPERYLDYFHGELTISPSCERIADNGWVWHPWGMVTAWSLRRWMEENPWESENGPSRHTICSRAYFWSGPICWVDDQTLVFWGYGNDDYNLIPAAQVVDAETGKLIRWFAGPAGTFAFDQYLFSFAQETGTSAWDIVTGERVLQNATFCPTAYHPSARRFLTVTPEGGVYASWLCDRSSELSVAR